MAEVLGAFTRALRDANLEKREEYLRRHPGRQRQVAVDCARSASILSCMCMR
jgi:hypothetical protein